VDDVLHGAALAEDRQALAPTLAQELDDVVSGVVGSTGMVSMRSRGIIESRACSTWSFSAPLICWASSVALRVAALRFSRE
jgi:hypothetical protein